MKKVTLLFCSLLCWAITATAQSNNADAFEIGVGGTFAKPKIIPSLTNLAVAQISVEYNLTTTTKTVTREKGSGAIAGAKLTAFLETTDGKLEESDFQAITDHFYQYFTQKLNENGIVPVDWNTITQQEFYTDGVEKAVPSGENTESSASVICIANKGHNIYSGGLAFAFGKANKASAFCKKLGAPAGFFHLTVDFADVMVDVDINTQYAGSYSIPKSREWKYNSAVQAEVSVTPTNPATSNTLFWNEKSGCESLWLKKRIAAGVTYHDEISQDPARMKNSMWAFRKEMKPVVIETTKEKYIAAAKKALENYADAFIAMQKSSGKK